MTLKTEMTALAGFNPQQFPQGGFYYSEGKICGELKVDTKDPIAEITFDKTKISKILVNHPILGQCPHYEAVVYDLGMKAIELLNKRLGKQ